MDKLLFTLREIFKKLKIKLQFMLNTKIKESKERDKNINKILIPKRLKY